MLIKWDFDLQRLFVARFTEYKHILRGIYVQNRGWHGKIFCTHPHYCRHPYSHSHLLSVFCYNFCPSHPHSLLGFAYYFSVLSILHVVFVFRPGYCNRVTIVLQLHTYFAVPIFPPNVVTAKRHCRYRGITAVPISPSSFSSKSVQ